MSDIIVYSKPNCQQCEMTKNLLKSKGAEYSVVDITQDQDAYDLILGLGYRQVPVVVAGQAHWSGFNPSNISQAVQGGVSGTKC